MTTPSADPSSADRGRQLLGAWSPDTSDLPTALAAAGVLAGRWRQLKVELDEDPAAPPDLVEHLHAALQPVPRGGAVTWRDPFTRSGWRRHESRLDPVRLAEAWRRATAEVPRSLSDGRAPEPIRLRINDRDATSRPWPLPWLSGVLAAADWRLAAAVERDRRPGRVNWDWPLTIGIPPTGGGTALQAELDRLAPDVWWLEATTRRRTLGRRHHGASLLVLPDGPEDWARWLVTARPTAEVALALCASSTELDHAVDVLLPHRGLRAVAAVLAPTPAGTLLGVLHDVTHDVALDTAVAHVGGGATTERYVVHAHPEALAQLRLRQGMRRESVLLRDVARMTAPAPAPPSDELSTTAERLAGMASDGHFLAESDGAVPLSEDTSATRQEVEDTGPVRHLQVEVRGDDGPTRVFATDTDHTVTVFIGPLEESAVAAPQEFPDDELEPDVTHRLTVVLTCPDLERAVQVATITLPPVGRSRDDAVFAVRPATGVERLEARVAVLHGNRVLQSWLLTGPVAAPGQPVDGQIAFEAEALLRARTTDLHRRPEFDGAVVVNHDRDSHARATVIADDRGELVDLDSPQLQAALADITAELDRAVDDVAGFDSLDDDGLRQLLVLLANRGVVLRRSLVDDQFDGAATLAPGATRRLQVLSARAESYLPLEVVYDFDAPAPGAAVCAEGRAILDADGDEACTAGHDQDVVCPLGFWGLNSVIERHLWTKGALEHGWRITDEPTDGRDVLPLAGPVLFGASHRADAVQAGTSRETRDRIGGAAPTTDVTNWADWATAIAEDHPDLLVALPHTVQDRTLGPSLTIGADEELLGTAHISRKHVRNTDDGHTVVVLLGCETANPEIAFTQFPAAFRQAGAQIVVGTLTRVVGRHAGPLAAELATELLTAPPGAGATLGEAMRSLRRHHLNGLGPVVLALVAYGDADWVIEGAG